MIQWVLLGIAVCALVVLLIYQLRVRKLFRRVDRFLDAAIAGKLNPVDFDESQASKFEAKLVQYLAGAKLRREDLLEEQDKMRMLISDISHQTKTPLANIVLNAQMLEEQPELSQESGAIVRQLDKSAEKLSFLIQSLVKISRLESGMIQVKPEPGNLYGLAESCVRSYRTEAEAKNIKMALEKPGETVIALYDAKWCAEAVCNIIDNAIKYTPENGKITISIHDYETFPCIRISDTGKGIAEDDLPKIFGRFYRAADSASENGVGIGLYLAREIIRQCGGYIQASSKPGEGSIFSVYLSKL